MFVLAFCFIASLSTVNADENIAEYKVNVRLLKAYEDVESMGNKAVVPNATLYVDGDSARLRISLLPLEMDGFKGFLGYFHANGVLANVVSTFPDIDEYNDPETGTDESLKGKLYPKTIEFPVNLKENIVPCTVYVPVMAELGAGSQDARLEVRYPDNLMINEGSEENVAAENTESESEDETTELIASAADDKKDTESVDTESVDTENVETENIEAEKLDTENAGEKTAEASSEKELGLDENIQQNNQSTDAKTPSEEENEIAKVEQLMLVDREEEHSFLIFFFIFLMLTLLVVGIFFTRKYYKLLLDELYYAEELKIRLKKFLLVLPFLFMMTLPVYADAENTKAHGHYVHPQTGVIEDAGNNEALGSAMCQNIVVEDAIFDLEEDQQYVTIKLKKANTIKNESFSVQEADETTFYQVEHSVISEVDDTRAYKMKVPSKNCVLRVQFFVKPMERDVIFYIDFDSTKYSEVAKETEGNMSDLCVSEDQKVNVKAVNGVIKDGELGYKHGLLMKGSDELASIYNRMGVDNEGDNEKTSSGSEELSSALGANSVKGNTKMGPVSQSVLDAMFIFLVLITLFFLLSALVLYAVYKYVKNANYIREEALYEED